MLSFKHSKGRFSCRAVGIIIDRQRLLIHRAEGKTSGHCRVEESSSERPRARHWPARTLILRFLSGLTKGGLNAGSGYVGLEDKAFQLAVACELFTELFEVDAFSSLF